MTALWHLALECSSTGGSVALLEIDSTAAQPRLHSQRVLPDDRGSVCSLSPSIEGLLRGASLSVRQLESLSVTAGPGSFTGLRVGLSTAKMLALACNKPVVAVDTLAAIARRFWRQHGERLSLSPGLPLRLVTPLNAFRKQVFTANWLVDSSGVRNVRAACVVDVADWLADPWGERAPEHPGQMAAAHSQPGDMWISGPGLALYAPVPSEESTFAAAGKAACRIAPPDLWQPLAEDVAQLGWQAFQQGQAVSAAELSPNYIRASAAEEKRRGS